MEEGDGYAEYDRFKFAMVGSDGSVKTYNNFSEADSAAREHAIRCPDTKYYVLKTLAMYQQAAPSVAVTNLNDK